MKSSLGPIGSLLGKERVRLLLTTFPGSTLSAARPSSTQASYQKRAWKRFQRWELFVGQSIVYSLTELVPKKRKLELLSKLSRDKLKMRAVKELLLWFFQKVQPPTTSRSSSSSEDHFQGSTPFNQWDSNTGLWTVSPPRMTQSHCVIFITLFYPHSRPAHESLSSFQAKSVLLGQSLVGR